MSTTPPQQRPPEGTSPPAPVAPPYTTGQTPVVQDPPTMITLPGGVKVKGIAATLIIIVAGLIMGPDLIKSVKSGGSAEAASAQCQVLNEKIDSHIKSDGHAGVPAQLAKIQVQTETLLKAVDLMNERIDQFFLQRRPPP